MNTVSAQRCHRIGDLNTICDRISRTGCVFIVGIPGIGKSTLLAELSEKLEADEKYSGKVILFKCREGWSAKDFYSELVNRLNTALGSKKLSAESSPASIVEIIDSLSAALLIDEFHQIETAETLNITETAPDMRRGKLIVASRNIPDFGPIASAGIYIHRLKNMNRHDAGEMLETLLQLHSYSGVGQDLKNAVLNKTGGHPLLVKLLFGLIISGKMALNSMKHDEIGVTAHFTEPFSNLFWNDLDSKSMSLLKAFSVCRIPLSEAMLKNLDPGASALVEKLKKRCLLDADQSGRIWMQDMLRQLVRSKLTPENLKKLHLKMAKAFVSHTGMDPELLREAYFHYLEAGDTAKAEEVLIQLVEVNDFYQDSSLDLVHLYREALGRWKMKSDDVKYGYVDQLILSRKLEEAERIIPEIKGWRHYYLLGGLRQEQGRFAEAMEHFTKALIDCPTGKETLTFKLSICFCHTMLGDTAKAEAAMEKLASDPELKKHDLLQIVFCQNSAVSCYVSAKMRRGLEFAIQAETLCRKLGFQIRLASILYTKSILLIALNDHVAAETAVSESREISQKMGNLQQQMTASWAYSDLCLASGKIEESIQLRQQVLKIAETLNIRDWIVAAHGRIGYLYLLLNRLEEASRSFEHARESLRDLDNRRCRLHLALQQAPFLIATDRSGEAIEILNEVLPDAEKNSQLNACYIHFYLSKAFHHTGRKSDSEKSLKSYRDLLARLDPGTAKVAEKTTGAFEMVLAERKSAVTVIRNGTRSRLHTLKDKDKLLENSGKYEILLDFTSGRIFVDGEPIDFGRKRALLKILMEFAASVGRDLSMAAVFRRIWNRDFDHENDANVFRTHISRLRKLLDRGRPNRFILNSMESGNYRFNEQVSHCIILKG
ncbi:MAG: AAA family ATPase [Candidatus Wallbacteria bacterium]|nr:AAA family ATPase [Candidatus Wallbacteria bacterium]